MRSLEPSKILAKMGRCWQADWAMEKIFVTKKVPKCPYWWLSSQKKSVNQQWIKYESSNLLEIFSVCLSSVCAKLTQKFLPLLNQPASNGPFRPKLWTALATVFVGIFFRKKFWWGSRPIPVAHWKEFWISWKKWRFQIFQKLAGPSNNEVHE